MKQTIILSLCFTILLKAETTIIELSDDISDKTKQRIWYVLACQGIQVDEEKVYIADEHRLYVQSRIDKDDHEFVDLKQYEKQEIKINSVFLQQDTLFYQAWVANEMFHNTYAYSFKNGSWKGPYRTPHNPGRIRNLDNDRIVISGNYRPGQVLEYARYAFLNRDGKWDEIEERQKQFYKTAETYFLSIFNRDLKRVDSLDRINRKGEDIRTFEMLYMAYPYDVDEDNNIYLIDNSDGYQLERWRDSKSVPEIWNLVNPEFKPIPYNLTKAALKQFRTEGGAYSIVYAVYVLNDDILTGFYQAPAFKTPLVGPFYFDITSTRGRQRTGGVMDYPIVSRDKTDMFFIYAVLPGGWFASDRYFLVGLTVQDLLEGQAKKEYIEPKLKVWVHGHP